MTIRPQLFGWTCLGGSLLMILFLVYELAPVREALKKMPSMVDVGHALSKSLSGER